MAIFQIDEEPEDEEEEDAGDEEEKEDEEDLDDDDSSEDKQDAADEDSDSHAVQLFNISYIIRSPITSGNGMCVL